MGGDESAVASLGSPFSTHDGHPSTLGQGEKPFYPCPEGLGAHVGLIPSSAIATQLFPQPFISDPCFRKPPS